MSLLFAMIKLKDLLFHNPSPFSVTSAIVDAAFFCPGCVSFGSFCFSMTSPIIHAGFAFLSQNTLGARLIFFLFRSSGIGGFRNPEMSFLGAANLCSQLVTMLLWIITG